MEEELTQILAKLGSSEKSLVKEHYFAELQAWARLIDEINANQDILLTFPESFRNELASYIGQYKVIIDSLKQLNISEDADSINRLRSYYVSFKNSYYLPLVNAKRTIQAVTTDTSDLAAIKKLMSDAKRERLNFDKSFSKNLHEQSKGSQRTLATYFEKRLQDLKSNKNTNPNEWLERRTFWLKTLILATILLVGIYVYLETLGVLDGYSIQIAIAKILVLAVIYIQYFFTTKNYHIYADLVAQYEHFAVISKTMTDFSAAAFENEPLKEAVLTNASKTLFGELNTGHSKQDSKDSTVFENIINQLPRP